jgi:hypothetical protein
MQMKNILAHKVAQFYICEAVNPYKIGIQRPTVIIGMVLVPLLSDLFSV